MRHPFRRTLPAPFLWKSLIGGLILGLLFAFIALFSMSWEFGVSTFSARVFGRFFLSLLVLSIPVWYWALCVWLILVGAYRAIAPDPLWRPAYFDWLSATPWTPKQPLPNGPPCIAWEDLLLMGIVCSAILSGYYFFMRVAPLRWVETAGSPVFYCFSPIISLIVYLLVKCAGFLLRLRPAAYLMIAAMLLAWAIGNLVAVAIALLCCLVISQVGTRILLRRLYESFREQQDPKIKCIVGETLHIERHNITMKSKPSAVAWPHTVLSPIDDKPAIMMWESTVLALLAGLVTYAFSIRTGARADSFTLILVLFGPAIAMIRFLAYYSELMPPISFFGRIFTGRWIIPRYDKIFIPCILVVLIGIAASYGASSQFVAKQTATIQSLWISLSVAIPIWVALNIGPTLARHKLLSPGTRRPFKSGGTIVKEI